MSLSRLLCRRTILILAALLVIVGLAFALRPQAALAHPLGNFTINHYSRIELTGGYVYLRYVLDMAEIPTFTEMRVIDLDGDSQVSEAERAAYLAKKSRELTRGLHLSIGETPVQLEVIQQELDFPPGQLGNTLRLGLVLQGPIARKDGSQALHYRNDNYADRIGWKEIVLKAGEGVSLLSSTAKQDDLSDELRQYPQDILFDTPEQMEARAEFIVTGESVEAGGFDKLTRALKPAPASAIVTEARSKDALTSLLTAEKLSLPVVALSIAVALGLGALHAASPGHGKTIMAAYLVGTRGTALHALFLGLTVTVSHTLGVVALGLVVLYASHLVAPERLYPWLGLASGAIVIAIGLWLIAGRMRPDPSGHGHHHHDAHSHSHPHGHDHTHHAVPGGGRLSLTWRSLTALGVVGGLVPSTSALVLLLAAISLHRIGLGLVLILAFSAGMAAVLAGVGLLLVYAGRGIERLRFQRKAASVFTKLLPLATALVVLASGLVLVFRAASQLGLL
jgi:nickel/cobalt exporter